MNKQEQFTKLYKNNYQKQVRYINFQYNIPLAITEDLVQNVYIKFYETYLEGHDETKSALITYFTNYLNKSTLYYLKTKKTLISIDEEFYGENNTRTSIKDMLKDDIEEKEFDKLEVVEAIINEAPDKIKEYYNLILQWNSGITIEKLSIMYNINPNTIKSKMKYVRKWICEKYSENIDKKVEFNKKKDINGELRSRRKKLQNL
jgi:RNA polymerase sigma factor (sigma-70 family)